ncbi:2-oxoglutarate dehydrogenase E1 component [Taylorella equigenitalis]|uniref:2-oxoglutarate dehydrogenase E1 component n=1 Tax=Taylorella equigenitalis TaxID=29575 RepID=UPI00240E290F|nr:2-oxoglutarate dehydrogenase E1 component [Taylorella equigenitalis]WFE10796.1 2-oxoglutarate dehydrogenase E1 component [Taylorella equigenitalis]
MKTMSEKRENSYLFGGNMSYVEEQYEMYLEDPSSVDESWKQYFDKLSKEPAVDGSTSSKDQNHTAVIENLALMARNNTLYSPAPSTGASNSKQHLVERLISAYRRLGALHAQVDPLKLQEHMDVPELDPKYHGLTEADMNQTFSTGDTSFGKDTMTLKELIDSLKATYSGTVGVEYMYIANHEAKKWLQDKLESIQSKPSYNKAEKLNILQQLTEAEGLEKYLHTKYTGQKRFSLEGGESFVVGMDAVVQHAAKLGVKEVIVGMAHRGRLNMLINIMGKSPAILFDEFEGKYATDLKAGDVKYHNGFNSTIDTEHGPIFIDLAYNPSHLEVVNPVVAGTAYARQVRYNSKAEILPVLVHGDAAVIGQGVVQETLNLSLAKHYSNAGTVHIIINNQIGFTTSLKEEARSSQFCTDIAKMVDCPIFHVNADDPEGVAFVCQLAVDYRAKFGNDVFVDIVCYRKLGHNEQDTPALTQPEMYRAVAAHPGSRKVYADALAAEGTFTAQESDELVAKYRALMDKGENNEKVNKDYEIENAPDWSAYQGNPYIDSADTKVSAEIVKELAQIITTLPKDFQPHKLVEKLMADRSAMGKGEMNLDWGMGEHLAYATLVNEGYPVRLTGEDAGRGTFTHRHAILHDQNPEKHNEVYVPLNNLSDKQARFEANNSVLSEEGALGFEYGYASSEPNGLTLWEGQFGDFVNGAQVIIDQFIASGEAKWGVQCGLVMLLPHGQEGQGPEHSSARIERFLQLCADENMECIQPTNGGQMFHALRRQVLRNIRKPLIVFTPKSLLRNKDASFPLSDLSEGSFKTVIGEVDPEIKAENVKRVLVCSGKVYYDLVNGRKEHNRKDVAILRVEQLYPFPNDAFAAEMDKYSSAPEVVWVQDEPQNQGPWNYILHHVIDNMTENQTLSYAGREASSSPATGYAGVHKAQQKALVEQAFAEKLENVF